MLRQYTRIRLVSDRHAAEGARTGMIGYVLEAYPDGNYEIEFSDPFSRGGHGATAAARRDPARADGYESWRTRYVAMPWHHAMKQPGYADLFRLLDEVIAQLSGGAVRVAQDAGTMHVADARRSS